MVDIEHWNKIASAPRDGRLIRVGWADSTGMQEWFVMKWDPEGENGMFPDVKGMWVAPDGSFTWTEHDPDGAPTHWSFYAQ